MSADELAHTIQLILAPVVMISACALTLNGLMSHFQAVSSRLRALTHERIELLHGHGQEDRLASERLGEIDREAPDLLRRHRLIHGALLAIDGAMAVLVGCMLIIALASVTGQAWLASAVLGLFLLGTLLLFVGLVYSAIDVALARRALDFEVHRVLDLER